MTSEILTHAFTAPQPHAWALARGHCPVWNSTTRPPLGAEGRLVGIHASCSGRGVVLQSALYTELRRTMTADEVTEASARGALIGVARLAGVVRNGAHGFERMRGRSIGDALDPILAARIRPWWRSGTKWGLLIDQAAEIEPIPMPGRGGLWRLPAYHGAVPGPWCEALEQWRKARALAEALEEGR